MGITDTRFGGELITKKGKVLKFDDLVCLANFLNGGGEKKENIDKTLTVLFEKPNEFIDVNKAAFAASLELKSPMGSNTAGFANKVVAENFIKNKQGTVIINWQQILDKTK